MKDERSQKNNAWFNKDQTCNMKHHRGIMHGLLYYYQRSQVLVIIIKDVR